MHVTVENLLFMALKATDDAASQVGVERLFWCTYPKEPVYVVVKKRASGVFYLRMLVLLCS